MEKQYYPLAPSQIPEWYAYQLDKQSPVYNISFNHFFFKKISPQIFVAAWQEILNRHVIFRLSMGFYQGKPQQWIDSPIALNLDEVLIDKTQLNEEEIQNTQNYLARKYSLKPFVLEQGPLFRLKLVAYPHQEYQLIFTVHHIIWDETSTINLIKEFTAIYHAILKGGKTVLPALTIDYLDYAIEMNRRLEGTELEQHQRYWLNLFKDPLPVLNLPEDFPRPAVQTYNGNTTVIWLPQELVDQIQIFLHQHNLTLFIFYLAVLGLYLYRLTGQTDFVLGCPIAGREPLYQNLLGCFAVPIPIRCQIKPEMLFSDLLQHIKERVLGAFEHQSYPCTQLIEQLEHQHDLSRPRLFSIMAGVQNNKTDLLNIKMGSGYLYTKNVYSAEDHGARFDLAIGLDPLGKEIKFFCTYNTDLFKPSTITTMMEAIIHVLKLVLHHSGHPLLQYGILPDKYRKKILIDFNQNATIQVNSVHPLIRPFEQWAMTYPEHPAIICGESTVTYGQLNGLANCLANYLFDQGIRAQDKVVVLFNQDVRLITILLALLKLGACYIPINPTWPKTRIQQILEDSQPRLVLTESSYQSLVDQSPCILLDKIQNIINQYCNLFTLEYSSESLWAYIIYTSGTTGKPKGIPIQQQGVTHLLAATQMIHPLGPSDNILMISPFTFDASILEIFWPLSYGARITVPEEKMLKIPNDILELSARHSVTVIQTVPTLLTALCQEKHRTMISLPTLRLIICGGSELHRSLRDQALQLFSCALYNHYGPTEITVDATYFDASEDFQGNVAPIGRPLPGVTIFILDSELQPCPTGVKGEIYICSPGLTLGYLNDPERNAKAFINIRFPEYQEPIRLFKSGDLGYYDENGLIYYCGRSDSQVKVNGNRVELNEVKQILQNHPLVRNCLVRLQKSQRYGDNLMAFIEPDQAINRFHGDDEYFQVTLKQQLELLSEINKIHLQVWPKYFEGSPVIQKYWSRVISEFPQYQFCLLNRQRRIAAVGNGIPLFWDGSIEHLPQGWDEGIVLAFEQLSQGVAPNTVLGLTGVVAEGFQGKGLSNLIVLAFRSLAKMHGLSQFLGPVRPVGMLEHKTYDFTAWAQAKDKKGEPADFWLRTHQRLGGKILTLAPHSQRVEGNLEQWRKWTGYTWNQSGEYFIEGLLQGIQVDLENNWAVYFDPSIWAAHIHLDQSSGVDFHLDTDIYRRFLLENLPAYMVPQYYYLIPRMPLLENGKIDEASVPEMTMVTSIIKSPKNSLQQQLLAVWNKILQVENMGISCNFFLLGGQSLQVIEMLAEIQKHYSITVSLREFYLEPTVEALSKIMETKLKLLSVSQKEKIC